MYRKIYTDGSCDARLKIGGWGAYCETTKSTHYGGARKTTSNRMELQAIIHVLYKYKNDEGVILSDSKYCIDTFMGKYKISKNQDLWKKAIPLFQKSNFTLQKVKAHSNIMGNEIADTLAEHGRKDMETIKSKSYHVDVPLEKEEKVVKKTNYLDYYL